ncbi:unnamed protein product [Amoebophrya sp. A120]|nr:unnamed protein product [Amoebophrya sp. A120]|eukprot:GSA120T00017671001.1
MYKMMSPSSATAARQKFLTVCQFTCITCAAVCGLLLGVFLHANPEQLVGEYFGSYVRFNRSLAKILAFMIYVDPTNLHPQLHLVDHLFSIGKPNDVENAIKTIDDFGWKGNMLINIGNVKGAVLRSAVKSRVLDKVKQSSTSKTNNGDEENLIQINIVEMGAFLGYGTLQIVQGVREAIDEIGKTATVTNTTDVVPRGGAPQLPNKLSVNIDSVDPAALSYSSTLAVLDFAGVVGTRRYDGRGGEGRGSEEQRRGEQNSKIEADITVRLRKDYSSNILEEYNKKEKDAERLGKNIDLLFLDHLKHLYLSDLHLSLPSLANNATVVADNILSPGAPDYRAWVLGEEGKKLFSTEVHLLHVEYCPSIPDEVLVSTYRK